jgi:hypothetical protein
VQRQVEELEGDGFVEDAVTKRYMAQHGIDKVRGGSYCTLQLSAAQMATLQHELRGATDCCFACGAAGHFVQQCPQRCGRTGHRVDDCCAKTHINGQALRTQCTRCGRTGHLLSDCFAKTHLSGRPLGKHGKHCKRCGRAGHKADSCYAKTHLDGSAIVKAEAESSSTEASFCTVQ